MFKCKNFQLLTECHGPRAAGPFLESLNQFDLRNRNFVNYNCQLTNHFIILLSFVFVQLKTSIPDPRCITESSEFLSIYIDSLFSLPSNIKLVRVLVRLCYGNETKEKQITRSMSFVRQENSSQIRFDQLLIFNNSHLCALQREALLLFEIYACFTDEIDSSMLSSEVFDGVSMRLIGWCSQALFNHEQYLITGECYLGIIDAATTIRTGFYSLRNIVDCNCPILTISFPYQRYFWPNIHRRNNMHTKNLTEISEDRQDYLCRILDRPNLLLVDHATMLTKDTSVDDRKPVNLSDDGMLVFKQHDHILTLIVFFFRDILKQ